MLFSRAPLDEHTHPSLDLAPRQQDSSMTRNATNANVGSQPVDRPVEAAAWVRLAQPNDIADPELQGPVALNGHRSRSSDLVVT
jgi:hypothetical protein